MKLLIDDVRTPPSDDWHWVRTSGEAITFIQEDLEHIKEISFDHDLGDDDTTREVALWLEEYAFFNGSLPIMTRIHSANPVGRAWLAASLGRSTILLK